MRIFAAIYYDHSVGIFRDEIKLYAYNLRVYLQEYDDLVL